MSFDFTSTFAKDFGEKLKIDKGKDKREDDLMEVDETIKPVKKSEKVKFKSRDVKFEHSMNALIVSGVNKGRQVEVRYVLPSNYEVEVGINYDINSSKKLHQGQIVDNCVVLAEIGENKYLTHCKKLLFLDEKDVKPTKDGRVMIMSGIYKGAIGRIIKYNESKIGALLNFTPIIINRSILFYNDLLLQNGKYFQVNRIELDNNGYKIYGFEFGVPTERVIRFNDILEIMNGFKIYDKSQYNTREETRDTIEEKPFDFSDTTDKEFLEFEDEEDEEDREGMEEEDEDEDEEGMREEEEVEEIPEMRSAFTDKLRVYEEKSLTKKKAMYYDIVKKILEIKNIGIDDIGDIYNFVDEIEDVLEKISNKLKIYNVNFDMNTSLIDLRMIIACMVAYRIVGKGLNLGSLEVYISELYENNFFVGNVMNSVLLNAPEVFNCSNLKKTKIELEKIKMLMICFDKELQDLLNYKIRFDEIKPIDVGELIAIKRRPGLFSKRKFSTMEDVRKGEIPVGAKKMVWSGKQMMKIKRIKEKLSKNKSVVDKYIYENIENAPLVLKTARDNVVQYLFNKYKEDFMINYDKCIDEKCRDRVIKEYLKEIKKKNEVVSTYLKLLDIVFEIMNNTSETDMSTEEANIRKRLKTLGIDNSNLIKKK